MLSEQLKQDIQNAYRQFLGSRELKPRIGQRLMLASIARTLGSVEINGEGLRSPSGSPHIAVVEAGTGTGKTVAYLLAVLPIAKQLEKNVVLSTGTVALQEQVVHKDLPDVVRHSGLEIDFQLAKGRGRYLCISKLDAILNEGEGELIPLYEDEMGVLAEQDRALYHQMLDALFDGDWEGDRDSWQDELKGDIWQRVTTDHRQCTGRKCNFVKQCPFFKARDNISDVDLVVANHDLVLADLSLGGGAILPAPEDTIYIFDEGHHLAEKALNHFSASLRYRSFIRWLGQTEAQLTEALEKVEDSQGLTQIINPLPESLSELRKLLEAQLPVLQLLAEQVDLSFAKFQTPRLRFERGIVPAALERLADQSRPLTLNLLSRAEKLQEQVETLLEAENSPIESGELEKLLMLAGTGVGRFEAAFDLFDSYAPQSKPKSGSGLPTARWMTLTLDDQQAVRDYQLVSSPVLAADALDEALWSRAAGAVLTSATLTALGSFDYFRYHTGTSVDNASYECVPSPFDYPSAACVLVPKNVPPANQVDAHTEYLTQHLPAMFVEGRGTLVLFASRKRLSTCSIHA